MEEQLIVKQEQKTKTKHELGRKQAFKPLTIQHIADVLKGKLKQEWIVKDGKVKLLDGRWMTPRQLLEEVKIQLRSRPELYDQGVIIEDAENDCGTVCCLGGWMGIATTGQHVSLPVVSNFLTERCEHPWLFYTDWDGGLIYDRTVMEERKALAKKYRMAKTVAERVEAACEAIDLFIKTEGIK